MRIEDVILYNLYTNEEYCRAVLPHLRRDFFKDKSEQIVFDVVQSYVQEYNSLPTKESLLIDVSDLTEINEKLHDDVVETISEIGKTKSEYDNDWLINRTEEFGKEQILFNAMRSGIEILDSKDREKNKGLILENLKDALSYSFDVRIGHDYITDAYHRFEYYHKVEHKIPFDLEYFNKITKGGFSRKTLNVLMGGINVGKTMVMTHMAAAAFNDGHSVLYITLEMSEEMISERIDANLMDISISDIRELPKDTFEKKIDSIKSKTTGQLIVKEYPTASAGVLHFKHLLQELELKKDFVPDIIYVDYLNLCTSFRYKDAGNAYSYMKGVSEELRGLAVEKDLVIVTATQVNRSGFADSDFDMTDTSESFGVPMTADAQYGLISTDELESLGQMKVKQLKSRYMHKGKLRSFIVGVDYDKMRLYDVDVTAQKNTTDLSDKIVDKKKEKGKFEGFKV